VAAAPTRSSAPQKVSATSSARSQGDGFIALTTTAARRESSPSRPASTQILYREDDFSTDENALLQPEMNILSKELGSDFFFGGDGENSSAGSLMARGIELPESDDDYEGVLPDEYDSSEMKMSYGNLGDTDASEMEMLRFDAVSTVADSGDLLPMMRFDSDVLDFEE
jgi:hypothetical protein